MLSNRAEWRPGAAAAGMMAKWRISARKWRRKNMKKKLKKFCRRGNFVLHSRALEFRCGAPSVILPRFCRNLPQNFVANLLQFVAISAQLMAEFAARSPPRRLVAVGSGGLLFYNQGSQRRAQARICLLLSNIGKFRWRGYRNAGRPVFQLLHVA